MRVVREPSLKFGGCGCQWRGRKRLGFHWLHHYHYLDTKCPRNGTSRAARAVPLRGNVIMLMGWDRTAMHQSERIQQIRAEHD